MKKIFFLIAILAITRCANAGEVCSCTYDNNDNQVCVCTNETGETSLNSPYDDNEISVSLAEENEIDQTDGAVVNREDQ